MLTSAAKIRFSPPLLQPALRYEPFPCKSTNSGIKIDLYSIYLSLSRLSYRKREEEEEVKEEESERALTLVLALFQAIQSQAWPDIEH